MTRASAHPEGGAVEGPLWHALRAEEAMAAVDSDGGDGLSSEEAGRRLERFGPNALPEAGRR